MRVHFIIRFLSAIAIAAVVHQSPAHAWGSAGHQLIGTIADQLLSGTNAGAKVHSILKNYTLEDAAKWPDCIRSVHKLNSGKIRFTPDQYTEPRCTKFEAGAEKKRMEDYASRNWATHTEYHFADIPIQEDAYDDSEIGANDHDVVHAINAAIAKLKGDPVPAPFSIKDDKEAILLLAHFVGDIHQPLHVGAIYLTEAGKPINPRSAAEAEKDNTRGGNYLFFNGAKLHGEWDAILKSWQNTSGPKFKKLANEAAHVPVDSGPVEQWAAKWATESVVDAKEAFDGIKFKKVAPKDWEETFANRDAYLMAERDMQWERVKQASARLAEIFKEIWP